MFKTKYLNFAVVLSAIYTLVFVFLTIFWRLYPVKTAEVLKDLGAKSFLVYNQNTLAIKLLELSGERNNKDYETYFLLGRVYFVENRLRQSMENYKTSIDLNPDFKESYYGRGLSYGFASPIFYTKAEEDFKKYIELDNLEYKESGQHAYGAWAGYNDLAWIYFLQGNFKESENTAKAGLEIAASSPWLLNMLSTSLISQEKCDEAVPYLEKALKEAEKISVDQFGEAYSGDSRDFWQNGKSQMEDTIKENLQLCKTKPL